MSIPSLQALAVLAVSKKEYRLEKEKIPHVMRYMIEKNELRKCIICKVSTTDMIDLSLCPYHRQIISIHGGHTLCALCNKHRTKSHVKSKLHIAAVKSWTDNKVCFDRFLASLQEKGYATLEEFVLLMAFITKYRYLYNSFSHIKDFIYDYRYDNNRIYANRIYAEYMTRISEFVKLPKPDIPEMSYYDVSHFMRKHVSHFV